MLEKKLLFGAKTIFNKLITKPKNNKHDQENEIQQSKDRENAQGKKASQGFR